MYVADHRGTDRVIVGPFSVRLCVRRCTLVVSCVFVWERKTFCKLLYGVSISAACAGTQGGRDLLGERRADDAAVACS